MAETEWDGLAVPILRYVLQREDTAETNQLRVEEIAEQLGRADDIRSVARVVDLLVKDRCIEAVSAGAESLYGVTYYIIRSVTPEGRRRIEAWPDSERGLPLQNRWEDLAAPILRYVDERERASPGPGLSLQAEAIGTAIGYRGATAHVATTIEKLVHDECLKAIKVTSLGSPYPEYLVQGVTATGLRRLGRWDRSEARSAAGPSFSIENFNGQLNIDSQVSNVRSQIGLIQGPSNSELRDALNAVLDALNEAEDLTPLQRKSGVEAIEDLTVEAAKPDRDERRASRIEGAISTLTGLADSAQKLATALAILTPLAWELISHLH